MPRSAEHCVMPGGMLWLVAEAVFGIVVFFRAAATPEEETVAGWLLHCRCDALVGLVAYWSRSGADLVP